MYGILCRGHRISNGDRISMDNPLTLMVGKGTFDESDSVEIVDQPGESDVDEFVEIRNEE